MCYRPQTLRRSRTNARPMMDARRWSMLLCCCLAVSGCGSNSTTLTPSITQVGGVWIGSVTQISASGGPECLGFFQLSNGGSDRYTVQVTQNGATLTATGSSQSTDSNCSYTGTAGATTIALNATSCNPAGYQVT